MPSCKVSNIVVHFNQTWKSPVRNITKIHPVGVRVFHYAGKQTDTHD